VQAQITQIEKYNDAVQAFRTKYNGYLPGDIPDPYASQFGMASPGKFVGEGDGNGFIEGIKADGNYQNGPYQAGGETLAFWVDLDIAGLIDSHFNHYDNLRTTINALPPSLYYPVATINPTDYIYVYSTGKYNYFGVSAGAGNCASASMCSAAGFYSAPSVFTVAQAYGIDKKIDDGMPQTGTVVARYVGGGTEATILWVGGDDGPSDTTMAISESKITCYDNTSASAPRTYSVESLKRNTGPNCALSFQIKRNSG